LNTQVEISWGTLVLGIAAVILLALLIFRVVALLLNGLIGRSPDSPEMPSGSISKPLLGVVSTVIIAAILFTFAITLRARSRMETATPIVAVQSGNADSVVITNISEARQELQNAVHDPAKEIPLDLPVTPSQSSDVVSNDAALNLPETTAVAESSIPVSSSDSVAVPIAANAGTSVTDGQASEQKEPASEPVSLESSDTSEPAPGQSAAVSVDTATQQESVEERRKRLSELASHLGPMIRSLLQNGEQPQAPVDINAPAAAESADRNIVVFQLPGPLRKTYAWIQLTPAVEAAVSPVKPLLDNGGLEAMANSLATLLSKPSADRPELPQPVLQTPTLPVSKDLSESPLSEIPPVWVTKPDGGRMVAKTAAIFEGEESTGPLVEAINKTLNEHLLGVTETLSPALRDQTGRMQLKLDPESAQRFIVASYERHELMETATEGSKPLKFVYALLEFPEAVDKVAVQKIRQAVQTERALGLGLAVGFTWLAVCCIGCGVRMWNRGSFVRRTLALPVFGVMAFPLLMLAAGIVIGMSNGRPINLPWIETPQTISLHVDRDN
jgi:hypothetical protein